MPVPPRGDFAAAADCSEVKKNPWARIASDPCLYSHMHFELGMARERGLGRGRIEVGEKNN